MLHAPLFSAGSHMCNFALYWNPQVQVLRGSNSQRWRATLATHQVGSPQWRPITGLRGIQTMTMTYLLGANGNIHILMHFGVSMRFVGSWLCSTLKKVLQPWEFHGTRYCTSFQRDCIVREGLGLHKQSQECHETNWRKLIWNVLLYNVSPLIGTDRQSVPLELVVLIPLHCSNKPLSVSTCKEFKESFMMFQRPVEQYERTSWSGLTAYNLLQVCKCQKAYM